MSTPQDEIPRNNSDDAQPEIGESSNSDRFPLQEAPTWFSWLEWVLVLGAFDYLAMKSGGWLPQVIAAVSIGLLWMYFNSFFRRLRCQNWFGLRSAGAERTTSMLVSAVLAACFWFVAQAIAEAIAANTK